MSTCLQAQQRPEKRTNLGAERTGRKIWICLENWRRTRAKEVLSLQPHADPKGTDSVGAEHHREQEAAPNPALPSPAHQGRR